MANLIYRIKYIVYLVKYAFFILLTIGILVWNGSVAYNWVYKMTTTPVERMERTIEKRTCADIAKTFIGTEVSYTDADPAVTLIQNIELFTVKSRTAREFTCSAVASLSDPSLWTVTLSSQGDADGKVKDNIVFNEMLSP